MSKYVILGIVLFVVSQMSIEIAKLEGLYIRMSLYIIMLILSHLAILFAFDAIGETENKK